MFTFLSIRHNIRRIFQQAVLTIICIIADSHVAYSNVTSAPIVAANEELITENIDLSAIVDPDSDMQSVHKEFERLNNECSTLSASEILQKASHCFINRKNMEKGAMYMKIAMAKYSDDIDASEKLNCATAFGNMGYYLIFERNNPIQAYPLLVKGLEICNQIDFDDAEKHYVKINTIAGINTNIAKIFSIFRDSSRALYYYRHAYQTARDDNNPIALPMTFTDLLHYAWTTDSLALIRDQIREYDTQTTPNSLYRFMHDYAKMMSRAACLLQDGKYDNALDLVNNASNSLDPFVDDRRYIVQNRIIAGKIAMEKKDYDKAIEFFKEAENMIRDGRLEDLYDLMYRTQAEFYKATGNPDLAEKYRYEGLRVRDSLQQMQSYGVIRNLELSAQANDFNKRLTVSRKETQRWTYIALGAGVLIFIICVLTTYILIKNRRLKEQSESLFRKNLELMTLKAPENELPEALEAEPNEEERVTPHPSSDIEDEREVDSSEIYKQVIEYMSSSPDIFSPAFTVETLADALGQKLKQVSQAINSVGGKNFNTLLAEFRIKNACERMLQYPDDPALRPTIEALAEEVGYKSRTHFMRVFKTITGLTTTEFLRQATKKKPL